VLARIIAGIDVPGSELGVEAPPERAAPPPPAPEPKPEVQPRPAPAPVARGKPAPVDVAKAPAREKPVAATARGRSQTASEADALDCVTPGAKTGTRGRTVATRGRPAAKPDTRCRAAADPRAKGKIATDDTDTLDCLKTDARGRPLPRGKAAVRGKPDPKCKAAPDPRARDKDDTADCAKPVVHARGKAVAAKGRADARCKAADKAADKGDTATKGQPARIWVQVAGGANEAALEKAWNAVKAKAPDLFRGRQGWTTPLRATNRVLTGPFKSSDEAQAFVNQLTRAGLSGFVFSSARDQKVDRLGAK